MKSSPGQPDPKASLDLRFLRLALGLAQRGRGCTSPNPMVGAVLTRDGRIIGRGWHRRAGGPHAEIEALHDAKKRGESPQGATLYVTLEPCCTHGRTPPCTDAIRAAGLSRVVVAATDPNPRHAGRGFKILRRAGIEVETGILAGEATRLNEAFNHRMNHRTPLVTAKAAMTLDGKIATVQGESKWITGPKARAAAMKLRRAADAILVGVNTVLADDPSLTLRGFKRPVPLRRIILDSRARTPLTARVVTDAWADQTTIVVTARAPAKRIRALESRVHIQVAPVKSGRVDLRWLLRRLGREEMTSLLVEGGGEVHGSFFDQGLVQRVVFFYAPKIVGGGQAPRAVGGAGAGSLHGISQLRDVMWRRVGDDLMLTGRVGRPERHND